MTHDLTRFVVLYLGSLTGLRRNILVFNKRGFKCVRDFLKLWMGLLIYPALAESFEGEAVDCA